MTSYVIVDRASGLAVQEIFGTAPALGASLQNHYEVVPAQDWLRRDTTKRAQAIERLYNQPWRA